MKIVHILPHVGGGVGSALESLIKYDDNFINRTIILLEKPIEKKNIIKLKSHGVSIINSDIYNLPIKLIKTFDIIHLDWWSHPLQFLILKELSDIQSRFVIWVHISGIFNPLIPNNLYKLGIPVIFSSKCSLNESTKKIIKNANCYYDVINSNADISKIKKISNNKNSFNLAYIGSQNFSKLHPHILKTISILPDRYKPINFYGNILIKEDLLRFNLVNDIILEGFKDKIEDFYNEIDILIYLLNPLHYGTSENALLEAMSAGIIPIVLNNECEKVIVQNNYNGIVINNISELKNALDKLYNSFSLRKKLSKNCFDYTKINYDIKITSQKFKDLYLNLFRNKKKKLKFNCYFSSRPSEWFKSVNHFDTNDNSQHKNYFYYSKFIFKEKSKSNINHFKLFFPEDKELRSIYKEIKKIYQ